MKKSRHDSFDDTDSDDAIPDDISISPNYGSHRRESHGQENAMTKSTASISSATAAVGAVAPSTAHLLSEKVIRRHKVY